MKIRGDFVFLIYKREVVKRRGSCVEEVVGEKRFFFVGSSWCELILQKKLK